MTINPLPSATISAPAMVWAGSTGHSASVPDAGAGATYAWSISNGTITAGAGTPAITFSAGSGGQASLSVTVQNAAGCTATDSVQIIVDAPPVVTITAPSDGSSHSEGDPVTFTGTASDAEDGDISANLAWSSDRDGALGSGASITTSGLSLGTHTITASVVDSSGQSGSASITVSIGLAAKLEATSVNVGGSAVTVNLTKTYTSPVVVCSIQYDNNSTPVVTRITNLTASSFDVYLQNPSGGAVATDNVSCLVVEEGVWTIDGVKIEAQTYTSTVTDRQGTWVGQTQSYGQTYTNPVVLGQVMSVNDPDWSAFWCFGASRTAPPSASALNTGKMVAEDTDTTRTDETIGFIVIEAGSGTLGGVAYSAALGGDSVRGVTNAPPYSYTFGTAFSTAPSVRVVTMAAMDGGNGGWAYVYGATGASTTTLYLAIDEDQVGDSERNHTTEQVGYLVFESNVVFP
jgi:hypothetical protein